MNDQTPATHTTLTARLPARVGPILRGELYEDPLDQILQRAALAEVTGGGTMMAPGGDINFVDIEIQVVGAVDNALDTIADALNEIGAPRGSEILDAAGKTLRRCGSKAIARLELDGVNLPKEVYETCSADDVIDAMLRAMGPGHAYAGFHAMAETTAIYFQGEDYAAMAKAMKAAMPQLSLCQGAKVTQIA
jgi:hypothetical protein